MNAEEEVDEREEQCFQFTTVNAEEEVEQCFQITTVNAEEEVEERREQWQQQRQQQQLINRQRIKATVAQGIRKQATKMLRYSIPERQISEVVRPSVNDCVIIPIPLADRLCKMSMNNVLGIIVEIIPLRSSKSNSNNKEIQQQSDRNLYDIATKYGRLKPLLSRSQFEICRHRNLLDISDISTNCTISLREAAMKTNILVDNCVVIPTKCHCMIDFCRTRRCICRRSNIPCNKKCLCNRSNNSNSKCMNE